MGTTNLTILVLYSLGMSLGQLLFKVTANSALTRAGGGFIPALLSSASFYAAISLYGALTVLWIWVLTRVPLSKAYPFIVLAFVFTPALASFFFGERLNGWYFASLALILAGLSLLVWKGI